MKVLPLNFDVVNPTNEDLGLSPQGDVKAVYAIICKHSKGEKLEPAEEEVTKLELYPTFAANLQRAQIRACFPQLGMFKMTETALASIPDNKLDSVIEAVALATDGNPADENSNAALGVAGLEEFFGAADLSAWKTPATAEEAAAAIPVDAPAETPAETPAVPTETPADAPAETPTDVTEKPAEAVQAQVVVAPKRLMEAKSMVETMDKLEKMEETVTTLRKEFSGHLKSALLTVAGEVDQTSAALPANIEADTLAVEA